MRFNVEQIGDQCLITREDGLVQCAPRSRLRQQMEPHGVMDDKYKDLSRQLDSTGKGTVTGIELSKFKFSQMGPLPR